jgi:hypothetical protein
VRLVRAFSSGSLMNRIADGGVLFDPSLDMPPTWGRLDAVTNQKYGDN